MIVCPFKDLGRYAPIIPGLEEAMQAVADMTEWVPGTIALSGGNKILVQQGVTRPVEGRLCEAHRQYLDVQYIVEGEEVVGWAPLDTLTLDGEFDTAKDKGMYAGPVDCMRIAEGYCYVAFPEDGHMPGSHLDKPHSYRKLVLKLKV